MATCPLALTHVTVGQHMQCGSTRVYFPHVARSEANVIWDSPLNFEHEGPWDDQPIIFSSTLAAIVLKTPYIFRPVVLPPLGI